ncbi:MAG: DUF420 domain-containing protein [Planctomycetaceae bacterium]
MNKMNVLEKISFAIALIAGLCASSAIGQTEKPPAEPVRVLEPKAETLADLPLWDPRGIQDFELTERSGKKVTKQDLLGKPWAICFIFTRCKFTCPQVTDAMRQLQVSVKDEDVRLVSLTVDPETDTPEQLTNYASAYGADPEKWLFLTGNRILIYDLIKRSFRMPVKVISNEDFLHTNNVLYVDAHGVVRGKYDSLSADDMVELRKVLQGKAPPQMTLTAEEFIARGLDKVQSEPIEDSDAPTATSPADPKSKNVSTKDIVTAEQRKNDQIVFDDGPSGKGAASGTAPDWVLQLPAINALLNGIATILLLQGLMLAKRKNIAAHKVAMLSAFGISIAFLACYLLYHFMLQRYTGSGSKPFTGTGAIRPIYFGILISHVILAAVVPILAIRTIYLGLKGPVDLHRKWAKWTFPIWVYVSVTGVMIYLMLYHWPIG